MDENLRQIIEENNRLLLENLELSRKNNKKIKKIHAYMRRTFVARILYWIVIVSVTLGAVYIAKPYVNKAVDRYNKISDQLDVTTGYISNPSSILPSGFDSASLFKDIGLLNRLFNKE